jgi:hypothetical protein
VFRAVLCFWSLLFVLLGFQGGPFLCFVGFTEAVAGVKERPEILAPL